MMLLEFQVLEVTSDLGNTDYLANSEIMLFGIMKVKFVYE